MKNLNRVITLAVVVALLAVVALPVGAQAQSGTITGTITQLLPDGSTLNGVLTITEFGVNEAGDLLVTGTLAGTITSATGVVTQFTQAFTDIVADLFGGQGRCDILTLDLGPLFLDLLGLQVDLSAIDLDITAVAGPGNLLGNLLCAVAGLLDGDGPLSGITALLNRINRILG